MSAAAPEVAEPSGDPRPIGGSRQSSAAERAHGVHSRPVHVTSSIGARSITGPTTSAEALRDADTALYRAKTEGKNRAALSAGQQPEVVRGQSAGKPGRSWITDAFVRTSARSIGSPEGGAMRCFRAEKISLWIRAER
ncbi:diguanylate cyclase domain-containing protein [Streptomyces sp. NBC_00019]|uniref:diguanylate cyclase domain-containing protein n=1 Tax=Streptomyces sp. NBC_00019 TaxID=2975623 RepID=UPI0032468816